MKGTKSFIFLFTEWNINMKNDLSDIVAAFRSMQSQKSSLSTIGICVVSSVQGRHVAVATLKKIKN